MATHCTDRRQRLAILRDIRADRVELGMRRLIASWRERLAELEPAPALTAPSEGELLAATLPAPVPALVLLVLVALDNGVPLGRALMIAGCLELAVTAVLLVAAATLVRVMPDVTSDLRWIAATALMILTLLGATTARFVAADALGVLFVAVATAASALPSYSVAGGYAASVRSAVELVRERAVLEQRIANVQADLAHFREVGRERFLARWTFEQNDDSATEKNHDEETAESHVRWNGKGRMYEHCS